MYNITMKRPDLSERNRINNPMSNSISREKMRQKQIGKKHKIETLVKMSESRKKYLKANPDKLIDMIDNLHNKYTNRISGTGWRKIRLKALERDSYTCRECGGKLRLHVHHIDHNGRNLQSQSLMNNEINNLITLCIKCHGRYHSKQRWDKIAP